MLPANEFSTFPLRRARGGIGLRVVFLGFTLVIIGASILWLLGRAQQEQKRNHRKALEAAEYGLQVAMQHLGRDIRWEGVSQTRYESGSFDVRVTRTGADDSLVLTVESRGRSGPVATIKVYSVKIPHPSED